MLLLFCAPAVLGAVLLLVVTRWGVGLTPDSASYVAAARSLSAGRGLSTPDFQSLSWTPMTHWPPLLPIVLSAISALGASVLEGARWLNALLLGGTCVLVGLLVRRQAAGALWPGALAGLVVAGSAHLIDVYLMAWTESLFIFLALLSLLLLGVHLEEGRLAPLAASAAAAALAVLTRYSGIVLIPAGLLCLLATRGGRGRRRIAACAVFGALACAPPGLWLLRNRLLAGSATNRAISFHPIEAEKIRLGLITVSRWFLPESLPEPMRMALAALLLAGVPVLAIVLRPKPQRPHEAGSQPKPPAAARTAIVLGVFSAFYAAFLVASICFLDAHTPLDNRILSPLNPVLVVLVFRAAWGLGRRWGRPAILRAAVVVVLVGFAGWKAQKTISLARGRGDSEGFATRPWRRSPAIEAIRKLPAGVPVYSNCPEAIYLLADRLAYVVPHKANPYTQAVNPAYPHDLARMADDIQDRKGVLLYAHQEKRWYLPSEEELTRQLPRLSLVQQDAKARIYRIAPSPGSAPAAKPASARPGTLSATRASRAR